MTRTATITAPSISHKDRTGEVVTILEDCGDLYDNGNQWFEVKTTDDQIIHFMAKELSIADDGKDSTMPATTTATTAAAELANRVRDFITNYTALPGEHYADILALYAIHTHAFDTARTTPYVYVTSTGPGAGKTRLIEVMQEVCRAPEMLAGLTGATMFRLIEARKPTLFMDEVDTIYSGSKNEELRGVLNSGYKHNGKVARVDNSSEDGFKDYSTFCPKFLAGIDNGQVPDTVMDRAIKIVLEKAAPGTVQPFYADDVEDIAEDLKDDIAAWVTANREWLADRANRPAPIDGLSDRQNDIARPLLTIANRLGWGDRARHAFVAAFTAHTTPLSPIQQVLTAAQQELDATGLDRISSARLAELTGYTTGKLGRLLSSVDIASGTYKFGDNGTGKFAKGFLATEMQNAFARFLS